MFSIKMDDVSFEKYAKLKRSQIKRATKVTVNKATRMITKEVAGKIPRINKSPVIPYRKIRSKRTLSTEKRKKRKGNLAETTIFMGVNNIPARYLGRIRTVGGIPKAGRHLFKNSFIKTMPNGFRSIFYEDTATGKLKERELDMTGSKAPTVRVKNIILSNRIFGKMFTEQIGIEFRRLK